MIRSLVSALECGVCCPPNAMTSHAFPSLCFRGTLSHPAQRFLRRIRVCVTSENFANTVRIRAQMLNYVGEGFALCSKNMGCNSLLEIKTFSLNEYWVKRNTRDRVCVIRADAPVKESHKVTPFWLCAIFSVCGSSLIVAMDRTLFEGVASSFRAAGVNCRPGPQAYQSFQQIKYVTPRLSIGMDRFFLIAVRSRLGNLLFFYLKCGCVADRQHDGRLPQRFFLRRRRRIQFPVAGENPQVANGWCLKNRGQQYAVIRFAIGFLPLWAIFQSLGVRGGLGRGGLHE